MVPGWSIGPLWGDLSPGVETEGDVATAFTLARILSNVPPSRGGPTSLVIFDIHALQERFYFGDAILPLFESGVPLLLKRLRQLPDRDNIVIAYPDDGAWKRFHYQFKGEAFHEVCPSSKQGGAKHVSTERHHNRVPLKACAIAGCIIGFFCAPIYLTIKVNSSISEPQSGLQTFTWY
eukprot:1138457-Pelagomonas_calceolata.AAC.2